jgi:pyridoxine 5-phosphate synthase
MPRLGVNIDHIATLREVRGGREPDPVWAAVLAELGGADVITIHLREDRRHIQERDLRVLRQTVQVRLNMELAVEPAVIDLALEVRPQQATLVPERRQELTTEGGLDVIGQYSSVAVALERCRDAGIDVALFIDPDPRQVEAAVKLGATGIELHTGRYANAQEGPDRNRELEALKAAAITAVTSGLELHAGHGLNYQNVGPVARLDHMEELNIGHSIISRALFVGLTQAVREMKACIDF